MGKPNNNKASHIKSTHQDMVDGKWTQHGDGDALVLLIFGEPELKHWHQCSTKHTQPQLMGVKKT